MSRVIIIQHVAPEGPGAIRDGLRARGLEPRTVRVHDGDPVPPAIGDFAGLVVMGGPMGVYDTDLHPHLHDELRLIDTALAAEVPVLGVCLGSQLLAATLDAEVRPGRGKEIGWHPVALTDPASSDALFVGVKNTFHAFHWHGDIFALPSGAVSLASSALTPCQAFRWRDSAYGLLFHLEVDAAAVAAMVAAFGDELTEARIEAVNIIEDTKQHMPALQPIGCLVFDRWAALVARRTGANG